MPRSWSARCNNAIYFSKIFYGLFIFFFSVRVVYAILTAFDIFFTDREIRIIKKFPRKDAKITVSDIKAYQSTGSIPKSSKITNIILILKDGRKLGFPLYRYKDLENVEAFFAHKKIKEYAWPDRRTAYGFWDRRA